MKIKKSLAVLGIVALLLIVASPTTALEEELTHGVSGSAYAYKISVTKEVIQVAGLAPCDKSTDPYGCDKQRYNQAPNCMAALKLGTSGMKSFDTPGTALSGGAGTGAGVAPENREPPGASPVRINELLTIGSISHAGPVLGSSSMSSDTFVELDGRANPDAHSESDAFVGNKALYEERCDPANDGSSFVHTLARSGENPETFALAECAGNRCSQSGSTEGRPSAREARTMVYLSEQSGKVMGKVKAFVSELSGSNGNNSLSIDYVVTYLTFESDGTAKGLKWSAITAASGVKVNGTPVTLGPGQTVGVGTPGAPPGVPVGPQSFFVGVAAPYVISVKDGSQLKIYAPGAFYGTELQTTYIGGAQLGAGFGRAPIFDFSATNFPSGFETIEFFRPGPPPFESTSQAPVEPIEAASPNTGPINPIFSIREVNSGPTPTVGLLAAGVIGLLALLLGWIQRFEWGRRLFNVQPLRSVDWVYRAFVRT